MITTYVEYNWRKQQCQIMTEQARQKTAARAASKKKAAAAAISIIIAMVIPAVTLTHSTGTMASNTRGKAAATRTRRSKLACP